MNVPNRTWVMLGLGIPMAVVAAMVQCRHESPDAEASVSNRPIRVKTQGYVGADSCRTCHPHNYDTWHASYHRTMTQVATPETVIGDFGNVRFSTGGADILLRRENDQFFVEADLPDAKVPGQRLRMKKPVVLTTGSHHMQIYWLPYSDTTRTLVQFRHVYLTEEQRWIPRDAAFLRPRRGGPYAFVGEVSRWNDMCMKCHATHGRMRPGKIGADNTVNIHTVDTHVADFGISCEACHGPGQTHVKANLNPARRYIHHLTEKPDSTIVNPSSLPKELSSQVCGQCHSVFEFRQPVGESVRKWTREGHDYRPGHDLNESRMRFVVQGSLDLNPQADRIHLANVPDYFPGRFWSDGMVRVSGREYNGMIESTCFERGEMSCLSCHQMHQDVSDPRPRHEWTNDQLKLGMRGNQACVACHDERADGLALTAHTHHLAESSGSNCYNCHMSYTTYGLLKAIRSHQIDSPSVGVSVETGRPNACNQCHLDRTLAWTADKLFDWYGVEKPDLSRHEQEIAASVLWLLRGDAGQRALMAWSYGWNDARQTSGTEWQAPYLAQLLQDPYDAVRFIAHRSLEGLPEFGDFQYDLTGSPEDQSMARSRALEIWAKSRRSPGRAHARQVLIDEQGNLMQETFDRILKQRDDRPISLQE